MNGLRDYSAPRNVQHRETNTAWSHLYLGSRKFTFIIIFMMYIKAESETVVTRSWGLEDVGQRTQSFGNVEWRISEDLMTVTAVNNTICVWNLLKLWILNVFTICFNGLPNGSSDKEPTWSTGEAGDEGLIPGSGRSPGEEKWQPTPVRLPENSRGHRRLRATVHGAAKILCYICECC